jgi:hypothetical protein
VETSLILFLSIITGSFLIVDSMAVVADAEGKQLSEDSTIVREIPNEKTEEIYKDTLPNVKRLINSTQTGIDTVSTI